MKRTVIAVVFGFIILLIVAIVVPAAVARSSTHHHPNKTITFEKEKAYSKEQLEMFESLVDEPEYVVEEKAPRMKERVPRACSFSNLALLEEKINEAVEVQVVKILDKYSKEHSDSEDNNDAAYDEKKCLPPPPLKMNAVIRLFISTTVKKALNEYQYEMKRN